MRGALGGVVSALVASAAVPAATKGHPDLPSGGLIGPSDEGAGRLPGPFQLLRRNIRLPLLRWAQLLTRTSLFHEGLMIGGPSSVTLSGRNPATLARGRRCPGGARSRRTYMRRGSWR